MSFDLGVWRSSDGPRSASRAGLYYAEICRRSFTSFVPDEDMLTFVRDVASATSREADMPQRPWAAEPDVGTDVVLMPFRSGLAQQALRVVRGLAFAREFACFDPQTSRLYLPGGGTITDVGTLETPSGEMFEHPSDSLVAATVRSISGDNWYAILDLESRYIQVGYGERAGVAGGMLAIERREAAGEHWRAVTTDVDACIDAMTGFRRENMAPLQAFDWVPYAV